MLRNPLTKSSLDSHCILICEATGMVPSTRNFVVQDPVWIKISDTLPWKKGIIVSVRDHESYNIEVDGKVYRRNSHHLTRRYPKVG